MQGRRRVRTAVIGLFLLGLIGSLPLAGAEVAQKAGIRVALNGGIAPTRLPRQGEAPVSVSVAGRITALGEKDSMPQLLEMNFAINRMGHLSTRGIPLCRMGRIDPSTTSEALRACASSLVGEGTFSADVRLPEQSPFPSRGKVLAFNGRFQGKPAILAHIFGTEPAPTSYVLPFLITHARGRFGTLLTASLPHVTGDWGFVTGISIELKREFSYRGERRSFIVAGCPAPQGFGKAVFPLMHANFIFDQGLSIDTTLNRSCTARG